jgi:hypothetical protein
MHDAGGACERGGIDAGCESAPQLLWGILRNGILVRIDHIDDGTRGAKGVWDQIACNSGSGKKDALAGGKISEGVDQAFGDVLLWSESDREARVTRSFGGSFTHSGDLKFRFVVDDSACGAAFDQRMYRVRAGKDQPIVGVEISKCGIERIVRSWRADLEDWNFDRLDPGSTQTFAELSRLVGGTRDEDAFVGERCESHLRSMSDLTADGLAIPFCSFGTTQVVS